MKLIVGLGNLGSTYSHTRHNFGFLIVHELAKRHSASWKHESKLFGEVSSYQFEDEKVILLKPDTMMNNSGKSVQAVAQFYKIALRDIWIVSDDLDIVFGKLRLRIDGSSGGHNGLKSIIAAVGSEFVRLRAGIANEQLEQIGALDFVLQKFSSEEMKQLPTIIDKAAILIEQALIHGPEPTSLHHKE